MNWTNGLLAATDNIKPEKAIANDRDALTFLQSDYSRGHNTKIN